MSKNIALKSDSVLKVVSNFKKLIFPKIIKNSLDMRKSSVHLCGTVHCHGGWYMVATHPFRSLFPINVNYADGANQMAKDLGFKNSSRMISFFKNHHEIWGNPNAPLMFSDKRAFFHETKRPEGAKSLSDIIDHWNDVYLRLKKLEEKPNPVPVYENITKQLSEIPVVQEVPDKAIIPEMV